MHRLALVSMVACFCLPAWAASNTHSFVCVPNLIHQGALIQAEGYKCRNIPADHGLARAGIHDNDVILNVDGEALTKQPAASDLLVKIETGEYSEITVVRNGKKEILPHMMTR